MPCWDLSSTGVRPVRGVKFQYFEGEFDSLPEFSKLKPKKEGIVPDFTLEPRKQDDKFAFLFSGYIFIPETGIYTFFTNSDDGSNLVIDGNTVVNNDGLHPMKQEWGYIPLSQGFHLFQVGYFEKTGGDGLMVSYKYRGDHIKILPPEWLYH